MTELLWISLSIHFKSAKTAIKFECNITDFDRHVQEVIIFNVKCVQNW